MDDLDYDYGDDSGHHRAVVRRNFLVVGTLVGGGLLALGVLAIILSASRPRPAAPSAPVASRPYLEQPARPLAPPPFEEHPIESVAVTSAGMSFLALLIFLGVLYLVLVILLMAWVAKDARARGMDGGAVWVLIVLSTGLIGLLVYMASRPHGILVPCSRCGNKKLMAALLCPHCGVRAMVSP